MRKSFSIVLDNSEGSKYTKPIHLSCFMNFEGFRFEQPMLSKLKVPQDQEQRPPQDEQRETTQEKTSIDSRKIRLEHLHQKIDNLFEGEAFRPLREQIMRSLQTPQLGEHHNEGMFMDSHIDLIMQQIDAVDQNDISPNLSETTKKTMRHAVKTNKEHVERYALLHDISKPDCMTLKFANPEAAQQLGFDSKESPITLEAWIELLQQSELGQAALQGDEEALKRWCEQNGLKSISYYQKGKMHGETGANALRDMDLGIDPMTVIAIKHHEDAFQFTGTDVQRYMSCYRGVSDAGRDYAMLGSYVDSMASLLKSGTPDLTDFEYLADSREKLDILSEVLVNLGTGQITSKEVHLAFEQFLDNLKAKTQHPRKPILDLVERIGQGRFDAHKLAVGFEKLFFSSTIVRREEKEQILKDFESEFGLAHYDEFILQSELPSLIEEGGLSAEDIAPLIALLKEDQTSVLQQFGKKIGKRMQDFKTILAKAKE